MTERDLSAGRATEPAVGEAIRRIREQKGISVRTLAAEAGFSPNFLSQVENGQASPSIHSLQKIVHAIGVTLGEFFHALEPREARITRASERRRITSSWSKGVIESLTSGGPGSALDAMLVTLAPGGSSGKHPAPQTQEEFAFVLDGTVLFSLDGAESC
jgi:transcriptional regulator with XRE-family HTH domain